MQYHYLYKLFLNRQQFFYSPDEPVYDESVSCVVEVMNSASDCISLRLCFISLPVRPDDAMVAVGSVSALLGPYDAIIAVCGLGPLVRPDYAVVAVSIFRSSDYYWSVLV